MKQRRPRVCWELDTATLTFTLSADVVTEAGRQQVRQTWPSEAWATWLAEALVTAYERGEAPPAGGE